jgi:HEAT repeat protein
MLQAEDPEERAAAAWAIGNMGPPAIPGLIEVLDHGDVDAKFWALWAFALLGPEAKQAAGPLCAAAAEYPEDLALVFYVGDSLWSLTERAVKEIGTAAVPNLRDDLASGDWQKRSHAVIALSFLVDQNPKVLWDITNALRDKNTDVRRHAAWALIGMGDSAKPAAAEMKALLNEAGAPRLEAALALHEVCGSSQEVVRTFEAGLSDKSETVRRAAMWYLRRCGREFASLDRRNAPNLDRALGGLAVELAGPPQPDDDLPPGSAERTLASTREIALARQREALDRKPQYNDEKAWEEFDDLTRGHPKPTYLLDLSQIMQTSQAKGDMWLAGEAAAAILKVEPTSKEAMASLGAALLCDDVSWIFRRSLMNQLATLGTHARAAEPQLVALLARQSRAGQWPDVALGEAVAETLARIGRVRLATAYLFLLRGYRVRDFGLGAFAPKMVPVARGEKHALPMLRRALRFKDPDLQVLAMKTLARIGPDAIEASSDIEALFQHSGKDVRGVASRALAEIRGKREESNRSSDPLNDQNEAD